MIQEYKEEGAGQAPVHHSGQLTPVIPVGMVNAVAVFDVGQAPPVIPIGMVNLRLRPRLAPAQQGP